VDGWVEVGGWGEVRGSGARSNNKNSSAFVFRRCGRSGGTQPGEGGGRGRTDEAMSTMGVKAR